MREQRLVWKEVDKDKYVLIPRMEFFKERNMATKIMKDKRPSRKREKQRFFRELRDEGWL